MVMLTWLASVLIDAGLNVIEEEGWRTAGRGEMGNVKGVLLHHTAGSPKGNSPSLNLVKKGRLDLAGPLSQLFLARNGTFHVLAAGRCNHAGAGSWHGAIGNSDLIGIEAENAGDGKDVWSEYQMEAYERGVAAILMYLDADDIMAAGHKEFCTPRGRKIDPSFDMVQFRENLAKYMADANAPRQTVPTVEPVRSMLSKGDRGKSVELLQKLLKIKIDGDFGRETYDAVVKFQTGNNLRIDGKVGPATWKALGE